MYTSLLLTLGLFAAAADTAPKSSRMESRDSGTPRVVTSHKGTGHHVAHEGAHHPAESATMVGEHADTWTAGSEAQVPHEVWAPLEEDCCGGDRSACGSFGRTGCAFGFHRGLPCPWHTTGEMPQHLPYCGEWAHYYYFRPYNHLHILDHQELVSRWGGDARNPYANEMFNEQLYEGLERPNLEVVPPPSDAAPAPEME